MDVRRRLCGGKKLLLYSMEYNQGGAGLALLAAEE
jgi:hypothetical protein